MTDQMKRYIHEDGQFKVVIIDATEMGREYFKKVEVSPIGLQLITQAMCGAMLVTAEMKSRGTQMFRFSGDGPLDSLTVEANTDGQVRGALGHPMIEFQRQTGTGLFQQAMGAGNLSVRRKTEASGKIFSSVVPLVDGEIAFNFAHYLLKSVQVPSAIQLGAGLDADLGVKGAGGVLIQAMPGADENLLFILENRLTEMKPLSEIFSEPNPHDFIINWLCDDIVVKELKTTTVGYHCGCDRQRMLQMMATLPIDDLKDLVSKRESLDVKCSFCNKNFAIAPEDLDVLIEMKENPA